MIRRPKLWNRGIARKQLMGDEPTMNPSPAAQSLLGWKVQRPKLYSQGQARRRLVKRDRTTNPVAAAAAVAAAGKAIKLLGRLRKPSERYAGGPLMGTVQAYVAEALAGGAKGLARIREMWALKLRDGVGRGWGAVWDNELRANAGAFPKSVRDAAAALDSEWPAITSGSSSSEAGGKTTLAEDTPAPKPNKTKTPKAPKEPKPPKPKKVARYNPDTGRRVMVYDDSEEALSWPTRKPSQAAKKAKAKLATTLSNATITGLAAGAKKITPAIAAKLARAGVAIGGLAAGYWIGSKLNSYLAGRALAKEEAGVQAALAFREARAEAAAAQGRPLTASQARSMGDVYKAQLRALGYDPVTFTRKRGVIARFFTGQEE